MPDETCGAFDSQVPDDPRAVHRFVVGVDAAPQKMRAADVRKLGDPTPVDGKTLFEIASNSKAFTAAGLAMLDLVQAPGFYDLLEAKTNTLCDGLEAAARDAGV